MREFERALLNDFPHLYRRTPVTFNHDVGWEPLVRALSAKLESMVVAQLDAGVAPEHVADVAKVDRQAGILIVRLGGRPTDAMLQAVEAARFVAEATCETCGDPGTLRNESETRVACTDHVPAPWIDPRIPKKTTNLELVELLADALDHLRATIGADEPYYLPPFERNGELLAVPDAATYYLVPMTALMYGAGTAFVALTRVGLEREALQLRRSMMEYYFVSRYYAEHPEWALVALLQSFDDERSLLEPVIAEHGSRQRLAELQRITTALNAVLAHIPGSQRKQIRPSMETLAQKYALSTSDYGVHYRGPSQLTHASFIGLAFGWEGSDRYRLRFDSRIATANSSVSLAIEYLLAFIDVVAPHVRFMSDPDTSAFKRRLRRLRRHLKIRRPIA